MLMTIKIQWILVSFSQLKETSLKSSYWCKCLSIRQLKKMRYNNSKHGIFCSLKKEESKPVCMDIEWYMVVLK